MEKGVNIDVNYPSGKNWCKIDKKRHDANWANWESVVEVDTTEEWKIVQNRECLGVSAHGGFDCVGINELVQWLKIVRAEKTWDEANASCRVLGSSLIRVFGRF